MGRSLSVVLVLGVVLLAACDGDPAVVDPPSTVVEEWLAAVDGADYGSATMLTFAPALALVIAVENDLPTAETAAMLTGGVPESVAAGYWASFGPGFESFAGYPLSDLGAGAAEELHAEGVRFAAVLVRGQGGREGVIFTRDDPNRQVDLLATLAPGFVDALARHYAALPAGEDGDAVRTAYESTVVPAMWAAITSGRYDDAFTTQAMALISAVTPLAEPSP